MSHFVTDGWEAAGFGREPLTGDKGGIPYFIAHTRVNGKLFTATTRGPFSAGPTVFSPANSRQRFVSAERGRTVPREAQPRRQLTF